MPFLVIIFVLVLFVLFLAVILYNTLIARKNRIDNILGNINALLKKRYDLIPNLIAFAQQYMKFEQQVLTDITQMRSRAVSGNLSKQEKAELDHRLAKSLAGIMVAVENYPDLKSNQNFLQSQGTLNEVEEQISAARRAYNAIVTDYNNALEMFPSNIMARFLGFRRRDVFDIRENEKENIDVRNEFAKM